MLKIETEIVDAWNLYTLENEHGMSVKILDYGGIVTEINVPNRDGIFENIVLAQKDITDYKTNPTYIGSIVGPVAGRVKNAAFNLDGKNYPLTKNNGDFHLHGGPNGLHQVIWESTPFETAESVGVKLTTSRLDGTDGYPGNIDLTVMYTLTNDNELILNYDATTDQATPLSLTNHSYFNLSGNLSELIHQHEVTMNAPTTLELDDKLIPTGNVLPVANTPLDFSNGRKLVDGIESDFYQTVLADNGYDHYFLFDKTEETSTIDVKEPTSGRKMTVKTTQPAVVIYTANTLVSGFNLKGGKSKPYIGVCFETQGCPEALETEELTSIIFTPDKPYKERTSFTFGIE